MDRALRSEFTDATDSPGPHAVAGHQRLAGRVTRRASPLGLTHVQFVLLASLARVAGAER